MEACGRCRPTPPFLAPDLEGLLKALWLPLVWLRAYLEGLKPLKSWRPSGPWAITAFLYGLWTGQWNLAQTPFILVWRYLPLQFWFITVVSTYNWWNRGQISCPYTEVQSSMVWVLCTGKKFSVYGWRPWSYPYTGTVLSPSIFSCSPYCWIF